MASPGCHCHLRGLAHETGSAHPDLASKHRLETINPQPHALMADVDPALVEKVFDIAKRKRKAHIHHHRKLGDFGGRFEIAEWIAQP